MKRVFIILAALVASASVAYAAAPPPDLTPLAVKVTANAKGLVVIVTTKNLASSNIDFLALDLFTTGPKKHYAVHRNGPGMPITVNPIPGHPEGQSTGTATRTRKGSTLTFKFAWKAIANPHGLKVRAIVGSESDGIGHATAFVKYTG